MRQTSKIKKMIIDMKKDLYHSPASHFTISLINSINRHTNCITSLKSHRTPLSYILTWSKLFYGLTSAAVRRLAYQYTLSKIKFQCPHHGPKMKWLAMIGYILS